MSKKYNVHCDCGAVELEMSGTPRVHAFCHCEDCRALLDVPYHSIVAWDADNIRITSGAEDTVEYKYPTLEMTRVFCKNCGETLYNTNATPVVQGCAFAGNIAGAVWMVRLPLVSRSRTCRASRPSLSRAISTVCSEPLT